MKTFGQPGSITPASFRPDLHPAMVKEGLLLLREMGIDRQAMHAASGMSIASITVHFKAEICPYSSSVNTQEG